MADSIQLTEQKKETGILHLLTRRFSLKEGQISPVFKSKFGYHIIQMVNRAGDDAVVRHILLVPKVTDTEINEAIQKLDSVRA